MANRPLPYDVALEAVQRVEAELRAGCVGPDLPGKSAIAAAAARAAADRWCSRPAFYTRVDTARDTHGLVPDWSAYRPRQYLAPPPGAPLIPANDHLVEDEPEGKPVTVCVIGDAHDSPHLPDKSRFRWLGAFAAEHGVDRVVSIGDWWTMDCFSTHADRATIEGRAKPTFDQDRDSFHGSMQAFHDGLAGHKPIMDVTLGNHEHRAWRYDNLHPDGVSHGDMVTEAFLQWGFRATPYGQFRFIEGVGFIHVPLNGLGRPMGGVTGGQRAANAALFDIIHGDTHKAQISVAEKLGPFRSPTIYNAATALPPGYIEGYASKGGSTWRSGVCLATIWGGYVRSWSFTEMSLLRHRYGDRAAA